MWDAASDTFTMKYASHWSIMQMVLPIVLMVTESARICSYIRGKQVPETCQLWLLMCWL